METSNVGSVFLNEARANFSRLQSLADGALEQLSDEQFFHRLDPVSNNIAIIVKHLAGNMISRWTDFLTTDGEKKDRNRPSEFTIDEDNSRDEIMERYHRGWSTLFAALDSFSHDQLLQTVMIRGESHKVMEAINRQLIHYAVHVGQILFLAKHFCSDSWKTVDKRWGRRMPDDYNTDV